MKKAIYIMAAILLSVACSSIDGDEAENILSVSTSEKALRVGESSAVICGTIIGDFYSVDAVGVYYSTESDFEITESSLSVESDKLSGSSFMIRLTELTASTEYYAKAYIRAGESVLAGNEISFETAAEGTATLPELTVPVVLDITPESAVVNAKITVAGTGMGERGVCISKEENPTVDDIRFADSESGLGAFSVDLTGLEDKTTYYVRAYVAVASGYVYSSQVSFMARFIPKAPKVELVEKSLSGIDFTTCTVQMRIVDNGGEAPSEYGVYYGESEDAIDTKFVETAASDAEGVITVNMTGLTENTSYYIQCFATNSTGTSRSEDIMSFHTAIDGGNGLKYYVMEPIQVKIDNKVEYLEFLDRNLGAKRVATAKDDYEAYGWLFQWGRRADGHQVVNWTAAKTGTFNIVIAANNAAPEDRTTADNTPFYKSNKNSDWLKAPAMATSEDYSLNYYWAAKTEDPLYASGGTNNPCPKGFRLPSAKEWAAISTLIPAKGCADELFALLKTPCAGYVKPDGTFVSASTGAYYWASDSGTASDVQANYQDEKNGAYALFTSGKGVRGWDKASGLSVRCVKIND